jgi:hypothetical protein
MDFAKRIAVLLAAVLVSMTGIVTAAQRIVVGEMITNTS